MEIDTDRRELTVCEETERGNEVGGLILCVLYLATVHNTDEDDIIGY